MGCIVDHTTLHRSAKYFMDSGKAATHEAAMDHLRRFGLTVHVGSEIACSADHQTALLTLINVARRTLLGGIEIVGLAEAPCLTPLALNRLFGDAVRDIGGSIVSEARPDWPSAVIGDAKASPGETPCWRVTWEGWRGGVIPLRHGGRLAETGAMALAPALAAAICAGEAFAYHAGDHSMAGHRAAGLSLWRPGSVWRAADPSEPVLAYLPSKLWLIGLGNLGQAFAWLLACMPYKDTSRVQLLLQDFDRLAPSNDSTSLLSFLRDAGRRKTRAVADWLEERGFETLIEERRFGPWILRTPDEPNVALCGVDNALARAALEKPGFDLVVEAGLGAGPHAFRSFSIHTFPALRSAEEIWSGQAGESHQIFEDKPAYEALRHDGMDQCGLAQLASRTVGVPFVGLIAGAVAVSELLRRLHGGTAYELTSGSIAALEDIDAISAAERPFPGAYVECIRGGHFEQGLASLCCERKPVARGDLVAPEFHGSSAINFAA